MYACSTYWYVVAHNPLQLTPYAQQDQSTRVTTVDALGRCPGAGHPVTDVRRSRTGGPTACAGGGRTRATPFGCTQRRTFYLRTPRSAVRGSIGSASRRASGTADSHGSLCRSWVVPRLVPGWLAIVHFGSVGRLWGLFERSKATSRRVLDSTHLYHTARQHRVDRHAPYSPAPSQCSTPALPGGPSGTSIDPALLESGLNLLHHPATLAIVGGGDPALLLQADASRAFSSSSPRPWCSPAAVER